MEELSNGLFKKADGQVRARELTENEKVNILEHARYLEWPDRIHSAKSVDF